VSDTWPFSNAFELATKHPNTPAPLCLRDPPARAGCVGRALGTSPKSPRLLFASQRCCPGCRAASRGASGAQVWWRGCWGLALNLAVRHSGSWVLTTPRSRFGSWTSHAAGAGDSRSFV